jgi:hypothetical protein
MIIGRWPAHGIQRDRPIGHSIRSKMPLERLRSGTKMLTVGISYIAYLGPFFEWKSGLLKSGSQAARTIKTRSIGAISDDMPLNVDLSSIDSSLRERRMSYYKFPWTQCQIRCQIWTWGPQNMSKNKICRRRFSSVLSEDFWLIQSLSRSD